MPKDIYQELEEHAIAGNIEPIKELLQIHPQLIHTNDDALLRRAAKYGHLALVRLLLTSSELSEHADIHGASPKGENALIHACENGHVDIAQYLLTSPDLVQHIDINAYNHKAIFVACARQQLNMVKFLLTSPHLKIHANIHGNNDAAFIHPTTGVYNEVKRYLILEYNITKTSIISEYITNGLVQGEREKKYASQNPAIHAIQSKKNEYVNFPKLYEAFKLRDFRNKLEHDLPQNNIKRNSSKI